MPFPRADYERLTLYDPGRREVALDLSDNTNLWGTHPGALEVVRAASTEDLARYPELYADVLRSAVSETFGVPTHCVTTGAGSDDVLDSAFRAAYGPDERVRFASPTFSMVEPLALMNGMRAEAVPWTDALRDPRVMLEGSPAIVYICRPNNPTGELAPRSWLEQLLSERSGLARMPLVLVDEAYADFAGESFLAEAPGHDNVLVTRTTSKAYGLAGLRCGFAVGNADTVLAVEKSRGPYKVSRLAALAAAAALRDADGWMARSVSECIANRSRLAAELRRRGLEPLESAANFLLITAPGGNARDDGARLRDLGVAVRPFDSVPELGEGLRVTVGPWPMMERFLEALDELLSRNGSGMASPETPEGA